MFWKKKIYTHLSKIKKNLSLLTEISMHFILAITDSVIMSLLKRLDCRISAQYAWTQ
jgi:hypothetical protein